MAQERRTIIVYRKMIDNTSNAIEKHIQWQIRFHVIAREATSLAIAVNVAYLIVNAIDSPMFHVRGAVTTDVTRTFHNNSKVLLFSNLAIEVSFRCGLLHDGIGATKNECSW